MGSNIFDDDETYWTDSKSKSIWDQADDVIPQEESKILKFNFRLNPKILAGSLAGLVGIAIFASVVPGLFNGNGDPKPIPTTVQSSRATVPEGVDLYSKPTMLQSFIDNSLASAVTIFCGNSSGSGWAIDLSDDSSTSRDDQFATELVTNNHVIEGCETSGVTFTLMGNDVAYQAYVYSYDPENDLAILITDKYIPAFATLQPGFEPKVGQWVMAVGSPGAGSTTLDGSITTGTVTNLRDGFIITDTTINPGNSGGPLLNSSGQVIGVVTAKIQSEKVDRIGIVQDVKKLCVQLNDCIKKQILK